MLSNHLKMIKIDRNLSQYLQIVCKNVILLLMHFLLYCVIYLLMHGHE